MPRLPAALRSNRSTCWEPNSMADPRRHSAVDCGGQRDCLGCLAKLNDGERVSPVAQRRHEREALLWPVGHRHHRCNKRVILCAVQATNLKSQWDRVRLPHTQATLQKQHHLLPPGVPYKHRCTRPGKATHAGPTLLKCSASYESECSSSENVCH